MRILYPDGDESHPQPPPVFSEEELRAIFGVGIGLPPRNRGIEEVDKHIAGMRVAVTALSELVHIYRLPSSEVGRTMDLRNIDTEIEAVMQHAIAARAILAELRKHG